LKLSTKTNENERTGPVDFVFDGGEDINEQHILRAPAILLPDHRAVSNSR